MEVEDLRFQAEFLRLSTLDEVESGMGGSESLFQSPPPPPPAALNRSQRSGGLERSAMSRGARNAQAGARRKIEYLPPTDYSAQLRKWRAKASLFAHLAVKTELCKDSPPEFFDRENYFEIALSYYERAWFLCKSFDIAGTEFEVLCSEIGFLRKVQGDVVGALEMAILSSNDELLQRVLADVPEARLTEEAQIVRVAAALEQVRAADNEVFVLHLLESLSHSGNMQAGLSYARFLARAASLEPEPERRQHYVSSLRALSHLGQPVAELLSSCGDVVLLVSKKNNTDTTTTPPSSGTVREVRAARLALIESSEYFARLLCGPFAESRETRVAVQTEFPNQFELLVQYLYVGSVDLKTMADAVELMGCAIEFQVAGLASFCGAFVLESEAEFDGETLAAVLLMLGDGFVQLRAKLTAKWFTGVLNCCKTDDGEELLELLGSEAQWDMVLRQQQCDEALAACVGPETAKIVLERMGGACSEDALVALAERLPVPEIAKLAKPEFFEQLWMLPLDAKLVMLSRLSESVEVELGPKWFSSLSDLSSLSSLSRALFALPTVFQRELPGMLTAVVKLPHPTTPTATTVDDSDGVKNLCWELIDRGEGLQSPAPVFAALEARRWDCVQILLGDKGDSLLECWMRAGSLPLAESKRPVWARPLPLAPDDDSSNGACELCGIMQGHLTSCTRFRRHPKGLRTATHRASLSPAMSSRDALRRVLSAEVFPLLASNRTVLAHAVLCGAPESLLSWMLDRGVSQWLIPGQLFSPLECAVWRGYSPEFVSRLLPSDSSVMLPPSLVVGWTPLHLALYQNQHHLLALLWNRCERLPYSVVIFTGEKTSVSISAMAESENLTDETLSAVIELTSTDLLLQQHLQRKEASELQRRDTADHPLKGNNSNNNNNNNNNSNNNSNAVVVAEAPEDSNLICSGVLLKNVKVSLFRKYTQQRFCSLLRGEQPGEYRWREAPNHNVLEAVELPITGACVRGSMLTVATLQGPLLYQIDTHKEQWTAAVQHHANSFPIKM